MDQQKKEKFIRTIFWFFRPAIFIFCAGFLFIFFDPMVRASDNTYIAQTSTGSGTGTDCANALAVSWFNAAGNWSNPKVAGKIGPGDRVHLCGTITKSLVVGASGASGSPITIYFEPDAKISSSTWENIYWDRRPALFVNNKDYVVIDGGNNGLIESTDNGTNKVYRVKSQYGVWLYGSDNCEVKNLTIRGVYVREPLSDDFGSGLGIYVSGNNNLIHDNNISEAETGIGYNYPGDALTSNVKIYNNTISRISNGITFGSGNTNALVDNVEIYNNDISDEFVWDGIRTDGHWFHSDGIQVWAVHTGSNLSNLKIYGNYVHGDMGRHITGWIFVEGNVDSPKIYNNILLATGTSYSSNAMITAKGEIHNNTIVCSGGGTGFYGGYNNIVYNCGTAEAITEGTTVKSDYNLYYFSSAIKFATIGNGGTYHFYSDFSSWKSLTGLDEHSVIIDPKFNNPASNFSLRSDSPAVNAGVSKASIFTSDKNGILRPQGAAWDIGAYEYVSGELTGDLNSDGHVNSQDIGIFLSRYGSIQGGDSADFDLNGKVDIFDYNTLLSHFGESL